MTLPSTVEYLGMQTESTYFVLRLDCGSQNISYQTNGLANMEIGQGE